MLIFLTREARVWPLGPVTASSETCCSFYWGILLRMNRHRREKGTLTFSLDIMWVPNDSSFWNSRVVSLCKTEGERPWGDLGCIISPRL